MGLHPARGGPNGRPSSGSVRPAARLRRQPGPADVPEDAEDADLAVLADQGVIAQRGKADLRLGHRSVTMLTSLPGTTITFSMRRPPMAAVTFGLARAACFSGSSPVP